VRRCPLVLALSVALAGCAPSATGVPVPDAAQAARVVRTVDGDTLVLRGTGRGPVPAAPARVRLLLVDAPEVPGGCLGRRAADRLAALVPDGAVVRVRADRGRVDRYDRLLLHVWTADGRNVGEVLLREGLARVLVVAPNRRHLAAFRPAGERRRPDRRG
jgi:endonuclease YncB( thermonuclease family)